MMMSYFTTKIYLIYLLNKKKTCLLIFQNILLLYKGQKWWTSLRESIETKRKLLEAAKKAEVEASALKAKTLGAKLPGAKNNSKSLVKSDST